MQAIKEVIWPKSFLYQLNSEDSTSFSLKNSSSYMLIVIIIYCNNEGAIAIAKNPKSHTYSKYSNI